LLLLINRESRLLQLILQLHLTTLHGELLLLEIALSLTLSILGRKLLFLKGLTSRVVEW
jgi:hypothetical protein